MKETVFELPLPLRPPYRLQRLAFGSGAPQVSIVAGIDGDEVTAIHALNLVAGVLGVQRPSGAVSLLPCVNTLGAETGEKTFLGEELDSAFVSSADSPARRVALAVLLATEGEFQIEIEGGTHAAFAPPYDFLALSYVPLLPLALLWLSGSYLFVLPYADKWRSGRHTD